MKYLLLPFTLLVYFSTGYYGIYFSTIIYSYIFSKSFFLFIFLYLISVSLIFTIVSGLPNLIKVIIVRLFYSNHFIQKVHGIFGILGVILYFLFSYYNPPEMVLKGGETMFILKGMFIVSPFKLIFLIFPFIGTVISIIGSNLILFDKEKMNLINNELFFEFFKKVDYSKIFHNLTFRFFFGSFLVFILLSIPTIIDNLREKPITKEREYLSFDNNFDEYGLSNVTKEYLSIHISQSERFNEYNDFFGDRIESDFKYLNFLEIKKGLDSLSQEIWDSKNNYNDLMSSGILLSQFESDLFTELIDNSSLLYQITSQLGYVLNKSNEFRDDLGNLDLMFESIKESNKLSELIQEYRLKVMTLNIKLEKYYQTIN